ncbi:glycosyltransferase family 4 protein [Flavobacteriaceae bacterium S0825]|uniref:glycosyltransferase family 4 protein n=1 Tax=Gaetbulibacter sp. S0825 TaxID=2720084 RepID=UPI0014301850|nr:glycosyltransferase family 4 protein [Gaetbulibacter sp. S0825]MCK0109037.1 glycosyltransferase family 4 protein [Flavobacteriaceae bacterium S0825]NIX64672.1 glycosyltransferase family 4 protein [Gaetbulibacter sp. S0825]
MHVGFLTPEYPHPSLSPSGGLGTSIKNLAVRLAASGVKVTVFVVFQNQDETFEDHSVKIKSIKLKKHRFFGWYKERKRIQHIIQKEINKESIDVLEAPDWTGISAFMKFSVPLVIRLNGSDGYFCKLDKRKQKFKNFVFEKTALKNADKIVSVSTFTGTMTKKIFGLKNSIQTIHNSIDVDQFSPNNSKINNGQILYFGTIIRKKGVLELAKAFNLVIEKNSNANLLLVGKDAIDVFTKTTTIQLFYDLLSPEARASVTHLQEVPYNEIKNYIHEANVVVLPSFAEAFPMTWLETLALEKPLVSSNIGWANELMVNNLTGFTVDPRNHEEFALKIIELLESPKLCEAYGKAGRLRVIENFSAQKITNQNIEFYKSVIN